jgi:hypothetical protein
LRRSTAPGCTGRLDQTRLGGCSSSRAPRAAPLALLPSLAFLRAPLWPLADSYRIEHGLTLEFPVNSSPEAIGTRPNEGSMTFPTPPPFFF